jgi:hypothetical protein
VKRSRQVFELVAVTAVILSGVIQTALAQTPPLLQINSNTGNRVSVQWTSQVETNYQLLFTENIDVFSLWTPVGGALVATNTTTAVTVSNVTASGFFKVGVVNEFYGLPTARICSPGNGSTVSDVITVVVGAQDDSRLSAVDLFLDDVPVGTLTEGDLNFIVDTTHFANGTHTLVARAQDNAGIPYLGGVENNLVVANETYSTPITLDFQNPVRWPEAETLFESFVPINVESDIFPAEWTVVVEDSTGSGVKMFSGSTADGIIETSWDGTDANNNPVEPDAAYKITVIVNASSFSMQSSSSLQASGLSGLMKSGVNRYGMMDYQIEEKVPDPSAGYYEAFEWYFKLTEKEKAECPPIPPAPPKPEKETVMRKLPLSEILLRQTAASGQDNQLDGPSGPESSGSGSTRTVVWRERAWSSGKTLVARQRYRSALVGATFNATLGTRLSQVVLLLTAAADELGNSRAVHNNTVFVVPDHGGYGVITNDLALSDIRAFYYHGHANGNGFGFSELTPNDGVIARRLQSTLGNLYLPRSATNQAVYQFRKPFSFVFIDGCLSATGELPEAFGIPRAIRATSYATYGNRKPRAYMGWGSTTQNSIANTDFLNWTFRFWQEWLNDPDYDRTLGQALDAAYDAYPDIRNRAPLLVYGAQTLRWRD